MKYLVTNNSNSNSLGFQWYLIKFKKPGLEHTRMLTIKYSRDGHLGSVERQGAHPLLSVYFSNLPGSFTSSNKLEDSVIILANLIISRLIV